MARGLVTYLQRPGNQAQMSMFVAAPAPEHDLVHDLVDTLASPRTASWAWLRSAREPGSASDTSPAVPRRARADAGPVYTSMASTSAPTPSGTSNQTQNSASERGTTASRR